MEKLTKEVFVAYDGKIFENEADCVTYEKKKKAEEEHTSYWRIVHNPDCTEGRGWHSVTYVMLTCARDGQRIYMEKFCEDTFGSRAAFVQGVAPIEGWILKPIEKEEFYNPRGQPFGSYANKPKILYLRAIRGGVEENREVAC